MENQVEGLKQEFVDVARKISTTYQTGNYDEQRSARRQLQRLQEQIEDVFKRYIGSVPKNVISNLTEQTNELLKKNIESSRVAERNEMVTERLAKSAKSDSIQEMSQGIKETKEQGVYEDKSFAEKTDQVLDRVVVAYGKVLAQVPSKNSDLALDEIRGYSNQTFSRLQDIHQDYTQQIKAEVMRQIDSLDLNLSNAERNQIEQKTERRISTFEQQMAQLCTPKSEVALEDAKQLSENELAFKDSQPRTQSTRKDLEAQFK